MPAPSHLSRSRSRSRRALRLTVVAATAAALLAATPAAALADPHTAVVLAANLRTWIMGILAAVATLFLVLAGVYWATAGGDPAQVDRAKGALRNALIGYALAVLAPVLLSVIRGIVGG